MIEIFTKEKIEKKLTSIAGPLRFDRGKEAAVRKIIDDVSKTGDKALVKYSKRFDNLDIVPKDFRVTEKEVHEAQKAVSPKYLAALRTAVKNIRAYHEKQNVDQWFETFPEDVVMGLRSLPIERVGIYVPGGTASYPSSVLMNAIPARIAGVPEIVMVTPPAKRKGKISVDPHVLVAAHEVGINRIYKIGGAQAVAALTFGTQTIPRVDKIVGPGNIYVTLAKKLVYGIVGIDKLAGPSDIVIIADDDSQPEFIAADLLSQAEHDPESRVLLISTSAKVAGLAKQEMSKQIKKLKRANIIAKALKSNGAIFVVEDVMQAVDIANRMAPEHLEIFAASPQKILEGIKNAGAVFLGPYSPVAVGDYIAGPNHVLPTSGSSRFSSPLGVYDFVKKQSVLGYTKSALKNVWKDIKILAEVEGLDAHARAVDVRFE